MPRSESIHCASRREVVAVERKRAPRCDVGGEGMESARYLRVVLHVVLGGPRWRVSPIA